MRAPVLGRPAPESNRDDTIIADLRARWQLAFDEQRVLDRLEELFTAHDLEPTPETVAALLKAADHFKINSIHPAHVTVLRTLQHLAGAPVTLVCTGCGCRVTSKLAGRVRCVSCAREMRQCDRQST